MRDTIDMAHEAGFETMITKGKIHGFDRDGDYTEELKAFEALVRADERNRTWTQEHWTEYERSITAQEREACAKLVEEIEARCVAKDVDDPPLEHVAAAIREKGTSMTKEEALRTALEALELNNSEWKSLADSGDCGFWRAEDQNHYKQTKEAITAIKAALASQRQWVGLTDEERTEIRREHYARTLPLMEAIEAKLKEKNT